MSASFDFITECGAFYVLTVDGDKPVGRPFGAIMEYEGYLYISTGNTKAVYDQMMANANIQLLAHKHNTRDWLRLSGKAVECTDLQIKQQMLNVCPVLQKRFTSPDCPFFALFKITDKEAFLNTNEGVIKVD